MRATTEDLPLTETATPADAADVAGLLRDACRSGTPVYPIGGGTSLDYGVRPKAPGVGLSLSGMTDLIDYPARDLTITAQAGITIEALGARLATERQRLPVDVPQAGRATLGGVVACSPSGPRRYGWGTMRDYVIGLSAVDGRGTPFSAGGRVVKNAAGYDLCRLMTGSLGTLGVVTQVTLMVKPLPETSAMVACEVRDLDAAERLLAGMVKTRTLPAAVELLAGPAWRDDPALRPASAPAACRIVVGVEGTAAEVRWMVGQLHQEWKAAGEPSPRTIAQDQAAPLWKRLSEFPAEPAADGGEARLVVRVCVLPGAVTATVGRLLEIDAGCSIQAHAGNGVIRARFALKADSMAAFLRDRLRPAAAMAKGHLSVLRAPAAAALARQAVWGPVGSGEAAMRALKEKFDPKGILNPGRFLFDR